MPATPTPSRDPVNVGARILAFWPEKFGNNPHGADVVAMVTNEGDYAMVDVRVVENPYDPSDDFQHSAWPQSANVYPPLTNEQRDALAASGVAAWAEWPL